MGVHVGETGNRQTGTKCQPVIDPALSLAETITAWAKMLQVEGV